MKKHRAIIVILFGMTLWVGQINCLIEGDGGIEGSFHIHIHDEDSQPADTGRDVQTDSIQPDGDADSFPDLNPISDTTLETDANDNDGGIISIYVQGDLTEKNFNDGLCGQTPTRYFIGLSKFYIMKSTLDPNPVLCFDYGAQSKVLDIQADNLAGHCVTHQIPSGLYPYGKVKIDWITYTVAGVFHYGFLSSPGAVTFFNPMSDCTYNGSSYVQNDGYIKGNIMGLSIDLPFSFPDIPAMPETTVIKENGEFYVIFPFTDPFYIQSNNTDFHWARMHWEIKDSFRWEDLARLDHQTNIWDLSYSASESEPVSLYGVSGYHITSSNPL